MKAIEQEEGKALDGSDGFDVRFFFVYDRTNNVSYGPIKDHGEVLDVIDDMLVNVDTNSIHIGINKVKKDEFNKLFPKEAIDGGID